MDEIVLGQAETVDFGDTEVEYDVYEIDLVS